MIWDPKEFKQARLAKCISLNYIGEQSGVTRDTISKFEKGMRSMRREKLERACKVIESIENKYISLVVHKQSAESSSSLVKHYYKGDISGVQAFLDEIYKD